MMTPGRSTAQVKGAFSADVPPLQSCFGGGPGSQEDLALALGRVNLLLALEAIPPLKQI